MLYYEVVILMAGKNDSAADSFKSGAEKTVNTARQMASVAKGAVKAGKAAATTAGMASGAATMGVGTAVTFAIAHRNTIAKVIVTIIFIFFIIIAAIASLPNLIFGSGSWSAKDVTDKNTTSINTTALVSSVKGIISDRHAAILTEINTEINSAKENSSSSEDVTYKIEDNYTEVTNETIYLAMSSYCIAIRDGKCYQSNGSGSESQIDNSSGMTNLEQFISLHEGFSSTAYRGVDYQNLTIGYGHVIVDGDGLSASSVITKEQALQLMRSDLAVFYASVDKEFSDCNLTAYQRDALTDFAYNEGTSWSKWPSFVSIIKSHGSPDALKNALLQFTTSDGQSVLTNLRYAEWDMYCNGIYAYGTTMISTVPTTTKSSATFTSSTAPVSTNDYR